MRMIKVTVADYNRLVEGKVITYLSIKKLTGVAYSELLEMESHFQRGPIGLIIQLTVTCYNKPDIVLNVRNVSAPYWSDDIGLTVS